MKINSFAYSSALNYEIIQFRICHTCCDNLLYSWQNEHCFNNKNKRWGCGKMKLSQAPTTGKQQDWGLVPRLMRHNNNNLVESQICSVTFLSKTEKDLTTQVCIKCDAIYPFPSQYLKAYICSLDYSRVRSKLMRSLMKTYLLTQGLELITLGNY